MWERRTGRLSSLGSSHAGYQELDVGEGGKRDDEGVVVLNLGLDMDFKDTKSVDSDSPISLSAASGKSVEGFEVQDVVGGSTPSKKSVAKSATVTKAIWDVEVADSSASDSEGDAVRKPLVKA